MLKKAIVIVAQGFEEIETAASIDILRRANIEVTVAGLNNLKITGSRGLVITADKKFECVTEIFDACVLPGGSLGAKNLAAEEKVNSFLRKMNQEGKLIAAICAAPSIVLAPLGILKNKTATCFPGMQNNFNSDTIYKEDAVVIDKNIITSRGPATSLLFALKIVEILVNKETSDKIKKATLID